MELLLFASEPSLVEQASDAGIDGLVVDLEVRGKAQRQAGFDTEITAHDLDDLAAIRARTTLPIVCRINQVGSGTEEEVASAVAAGADELLVPMVRHERELEAVYEAADGAVPVGTMVETDAAVARAASLVSLPVARVYVGLNDLHVERGSSHLFQGIADGTVEAVRAATVPVPFGFAGLTVPSGGRPLPAHHLIGELDRLHTDFTFLRRSFFRDVINREPAAVVAEIRAALERARQRDDHQIHADRQAMLDAIAALPEGPW